MAEELPSASIPPTVTSSRRGLAPFVVAATAVIAYLNSLRGGFTLDDFPLILDNPRVADPAWLWSLFTDGRMWRPLKRVSFAIDWRIWGPEHPAGFHATNVALHAACCVALWAVAIRLGLRRGAAFAAALLFALHPIHAEAIANISHRKEPMALLFTLLGFLAYLRGRKAEGALARAKWVAASAAAYLCGMMSKEVGAVMLPAAVAVHEIFVARDPLRARISRLAAFLPALGLVVVLFTVHGYIGTLPRRFEPEQIRWITQERASDYGTIVRIAAKAFGQNVGLLAWPWPLYFDRKFAIPTSFLDPGVTAGFLVLAGYLLGLGVSLRRDPVLFFALAWFGLYLLPVSGVVPLTYWYVAERFLYAPSAGFALAVGLGFDEACARAGAARAAVLRWSGLAILVLCAGLTIQQNRVWKSQESLFTHTLRYNPESHRALYGIGLLRERDGDRAAAAGFFEEAIRSGPTYGEPHYALGLLRLEEGRLDEAIALAETAARLMPKDPQPLVLEGNAQLARKSYVEAEDAYRRALDRAPGDPDILYNLGLARSAAGE